MLPFRLTSTGFTINANEMRSQDKRKSTFNLTSAKNTGIKALFCFYLNHIGLISVDCCFVLGIFKAQIKILAEKVATITS